MLNNRLETAENMNHEHIPLFICSDIQDFSCPKPANQSKKFSPRNSNVDSKLESSRCTVDEEQDNTEEVLQTATVFAHTNTADISPHACSGVHASPERANATVDGTEHKN